MRHLMFAAALIVAVVLQAGCKPTPRAKAASASPARPATTANASTPASAQPAVAPSTAAPTSPAKAKSVPTLPKAAFFAADAEVKKIEQAMHDVLAAVIDDETARKAAEELPKLTRRWEPAQKQATLLYLALSEEEKNAALDELQQKGLEKLKRGEIPKKPAAVLMIDLAKGPHRPILHDAIVQFRDTFLAQHSIYAPLLAREKMAEKMGAVGTPLPE
jgi:hypothetical protein